MLKNKLPGKWFTVFRVCTYTTEDCIETFDINDLHSLFCSTGCCFGWGLYFALFFQLCHFLFILLVQEKVPCVVWGNFPGYLIGHCVPVVVVLSVIIQGSLPNSGGLCGQDRKCKWILKPDKFHWTIILLGKSVFTKGGGGNFLAWEGGAMIYPIN